MTDSIDVSNNTILIPPPKKGEVINLNKLINQAPEGSIIRFSEGIYLVNATIALTKSIRLEGAGIDKTVIRGTETKPTTLLESTGESNIELEGISFEGNNTYKMQVASISVKNVKILECSFSGGATHSIKKKSDAVCGKGLLIKGETEFKIYRCKFECNQESGLGIIDQAVGLITGCDFINKNGFGLWITDQVKAVINESNFTKNDIGLVIESHAKAMIDGSIFTENYHGLWVSGTAIVDIKTCIFKHNFNCGALYKESSCGLLTYNIFSDFSEGAFFSGCLDIEGNSSVRVLNNKFTKCDTAFSTEGNSIVSIEGNEFFYNGSGISINGYSKAVILQNRVYKNRKRGIHTHDRASVEILDNQIQENQGIGIYIGGDNKSTAVVKRNKLIRNESNFSKSKSSKVIFTENQEIVMGRGSVSYQLVEGVLIVSPPVSGDKVDFNELIATANPGQEIRIRSGHYPLAEPIRVDKSLRFVADKPGKVILIGGPFEALIDFSSNDNLTLSGIKFQVTSEQRSNGITINSGNLVMDHCEFGCVNSQELTQNEIGAGVLLRGQSYAQISDSYFYRNGSGIFIHDRATIDLINSKFSYNRRGLVLAEDSIGSIINNEFSKNLGFGFMACGRSTVEVIGNSCERNLAGFGFADDTKAKIINNTSYNNKSRGVFIDNNAQCTLIKNSCSSNKISGVIVCGKARAYIEKNETFKNKHGFEVWENARAVIIDNSIFDNNRGIKLTDSADVTIESNRIYENKIGIQICDKAVARVSGNKIINNHEKSLKYEEKNKPTLGENEIVEYVKGASSDIIFEEDDESEIERQAGNSGDLFAQILGSENLSKDPNLAIIPLKKYFDEGSKKKKTEVRNSTEESMALAAKGMVKYKKHDIQGAIRDYTKAIQLLPEKNGYIYATRGQFYYAAEDYTLAIADLSEALTFEPKNDNFLKWRARSFKKMEKQKKALADLDEAIRLNQKDFELFMDRGLLLLEKGDMEKAQEDFSSAIKLKPNNPQTWLHRCIALRELGEYEKALEDVNTSIKLDPDDHGFYFLRGSIYAEKGGWKEAIADYEEYLKFEEEWINDAEEIKETISEMKKKLESG